MYFRRQRQMCIRDSPNDAPETTEEGLVLKFHDEFNGTGEPDWNVWRWEEGFQRNQELQWYQKENAICKDGALIITGKEERVKNTNYEAGSSDWKKNREYLFVQWESK